MTSSDTAGVLNTRRVACHIGGAISDIDLVGPSDDVLITALRQALLTHKVLFFRDHHLGHSAHITLGARFGKLPSRSRPQEASHA